MEWIGDLERAFAAIIYPNRVAIAMGGLAIVVVLVVVARRRRWDRPIRRHPVRTAAILVPVLAVAVPLSWYLASPLVLSTTIDEPAPIVGVVDSSPTPSPRSGGPSGAASEGPPTLAPTSPPLALSGTLVGADEFHFGRGTARLIETSPGTYVLRLEDFAVRNGPDLFVYVSPSAAGYVDGAIELGRLKADAGNQNYEIPASFDPSTAGSVVIWCRQFSVQFAVAPLSS
jgi:hypothetical protein